MATKLTEFRSESIEYISMGKLDISGLNVRKRQITADLEELAANIDRFGLQQPIVVMEQGERYSIITGQRRYLAAKHLGWETIAAFVLAKSLEPVEAMVLSFSENVQRRELSAKDKSEACLYLFNELGAVGKVAEELGISRQTVRKWLDYAGVPEPIKEFVQPGGLTVQQATRIWQYMDDEETAIEIARNVAAETVKESRDRILDSAKELPGRSADAILRRAEERGNLREIHFELTESSARAMEEASWATDTDANDLAKEVTIQWLEDNRYLL